jgi:predicted transcriptional regulator
MIDVTPHVPFGESNALSTREIWRTLDCWAEETVGQNLYKLSEEGKIKRRAQTVQGSTFKWVYWREAASE